MAKAKKTTAAESNEKTSAQAPKSEKAKPAALAAAAPTPASGAKKNAPAKKAAAAAPTTAIPRIDTDLAAQSAAAMLVNRASTQAQPAGKTESAAFKNLKDQIAKPKPAALSHILGTPGEQKKGPGHFFNQQKGHNQTYGGFNKTGVPRRTNG